MFDCAAFSLLFRRGPAGGAVSSCGFMSGLVVPGGVDVLHCETDADCLMHIRRHLVEKNY